MINRILCCIEFLAEVVVDSDLQINRNMRCIEIPIFFGLHQHLPRLIETWDVLKCAFFCAIRSSSKGLIETWDVLKFRCRANPPRESRSCRGGQKAEINRNMGCIEISQSFLLARSTCWINRNMRCIEMYFQKHL